MIPALSKGAFHLPENIGKYSFYVIQQISASNKNPSNVLLAWIIAWAYAEPHELLAVQIKRTLKVELPNNFEEAFNRVMQMLNNPDFRAAAIKAFGMAISKYRVREDIKALAYDAPTERVLTGLKTIAQEMPGSNVLNILIRDVEYIQQMKTGTTPTPTTVSQPTPQRQAPISAQPPSPTQPQSTLSPLPTPKVPSVKPESLKSMIVEAVKSAYGNKMEELLKTVKELSGRIDTIEGFINILRGEVSDIKMYMQSIRDDIETLKESVNKLMSLRTHPLNRDVMEALKEAAKVIGFEIVETEQEALEKAILSPPEKPPEQPPQTQPEEAIKKPSVKIEIPEKPKEIPSISPSKHPPSAVKTKPREMELLISLWGDTEALKKFSDFLSEHKIGPFRWQVTTEVDGTIFKITIQAAVRGLPLKYKKELINKSQGIIIASTDKPLQEISKVLLAFKNLKFIVWGASEPPKEILDQGLIVESGFIESKEDMLSLLHRVLPKVVNAL